MIKKRHLLSYCLFISSWTSALASSIAVPEQPANLTTVERQAWYQQLHWPANCEEDFSDANSNPSYSGLNFWKLADNQTYLVEINCFWGAYQGNFRYMLYNPTSKPILKKLLTFKTFHQAGKVLSKPLVSSTVVGIPTFSDAQQQLTVITKERGTGDCGTQALYHISATGAELSRFAAKFKCDSDPSGYISYYP